MKTNKKFFSIALMLCLTYQLFAQTEKVIRNSEVEGIYLNISDFQKGKLTRPTDRQHKGDKIKLKQFYISPDIISVEQGKETIFYKDSIFAIRLTNGESYRFINRIPYLLADTSSLYIYVHKTIKTEYVKSGPKRISKKVSVSNYFFSKQGEMVVYELNLINLRKYVLTSAALHTAVCSKFLTDSMLYTVNSISGRYELNETILSQTP